MRGMSNPATEAFVNEVQTRAEKLGLKAEAVIAQAGYSRATWRNWSTGYSTPSLEVATKVRNELTQLEKRRLKKSA